ncbi:MAG: type II secretion system protein [Candidatus Paceibacterota bacterium]
MNKILIKKKGGFTLIEMLVYLSIMVIVTITLVQSFIVILKSNKISFTNSVLRNSGYSIMENIIREVRSSKTINQCGSGILELTQSDNNIVKFYKNSDGLLLLSEGSPTLINKGFLNNKGSRISELSCNSIDTGKSKALKIKLVLETEIGGQSKSENFYSTIILRGSY